MARIQKGRVPPGEPDENGEYIYVHKRADDRSLWVKAAYWREKYAPLIWLVIAFLVALGFEFKTPRTIVRESVGEMKADVAKIQTQLDTVRLHERNADQERETITRMLRYLVAKECLQAMSDRNSERGMQLAGINCQLVLNAGTAGLPR